MNEAQTISHNRPESADESQSIAGPELSVIVPTFNEYANVGELIRRLRECLTGCDWEVVFVDDDSPDRTAERAREFARSDHRVRCLQRIGRRGLTTACIEGMLASSAPYLAVIDGDMQHDETLLPKMLQVLKDEDADIVVGTRYAAEGGVGDWDQTRAGISRFATRLGRFVLKADLSDPMSGFFMLRRGVIEKSVRKLSGMGFKILFDIFASSPTPLKFKALPYKFRSRHAGESKLDSHAVWDYLMLLLDKLIGHVVPVRFVSFALVGGFGVVIHFLILDLVFNRLQYSFTTSQAVATLVAITVNFILNNILTYRDMRLRGWRAVRGWLSFTVSCSIGALTNVGIASYLFSLNARWVLAALAGILVGAVWNYAVTMIYTWKKNAA